MTKPEEISVTLQPVKDLPKEKFDELGAFIDNMEKTKGELIGILYKAQEIFGYLPRDVQLFIARKLGIPAAEVFGVVSFYTYFTTKPKARHTIRVCMGTACFVKGAGEILQKLKEKLGINSDEITKDGQFALQSVRCIGACGLAPVIMIDDKTYGRIKAEDIDDILKEYK